MLPTATQTYSADSAAPRRLPIGVVSSPLLKLVNTQRFVSFADHSHHEGVHHTVGNPTCFLRLGSALPLASHICKYFKWTESHAQTRRGFTSPAFVYSYAISDIISFFKKDFQG